MSGMGQWQASWATLMVGNSEGGSVGGGIAHVCAQPLYIQQKYITNVQLYIQRMYITNVHKLKTLSWERAHPAMGVFNHHLIRLARLGSVCWWDLENDAFVYTSEASAIC